MIISKNSTQTLVFHSHYSDYTNLAHLLFYLSKEIETERNTEAETESQKARAVAPQLKKAEKSEFQVGFRIFFVRSFSVLCLFVICVLLSGDFPFVPSLCVSLSLSLSISFSGEKEKEVTRRRQKKKPSNRKEGPGTPDKGIVPQADSFFYALCLFLVFLLSLSVFFYLSSFLCVYLIRQEVSQIV